MAELREAHAGGGVAQLAHSWASRSQAGCQKEEGASGAVSRGSLAGVSGGGPCFTAEAQLAPKVASVLESRM